MLFLLLFFFLNLNSFHSSFFFAILFIVACDFFSTSLSLTLVACVRDGFFVVDDEADELTLSLL
jgi:hypothetical protein